MEETPANRFMRLRNQRWPEIIVGQKLCPLTTLAMSLTTNAACSLQEASS